MAKYSLPQKERLKQQDHFKHVYETETKVYGRFFMAYYRRKLGSDRRVAFVAGKKIGGAVIRNRVKRKLKEVMRVHQHQVSKLYDLVIIPRYTSIDSPVADISDDFVQVFQDEGLWLE